MLIYFHSSRLLFITYTRPKYIIKIHGLPGGLLDVIPRPRFGTSHRSEMLRSYGPGLEPSTVQHVDDIRTHGLGTTAHRIGNCFMEGWYQY